MMFKRRGGGEGKRGEGIKRVGRKKGDKWREESSFKKIKRK